MVCVVKGLESKDNYMSWAFLNCSVCTVLYDVWVVGKHK